MVQYPPKTLLHNVSSLEYASGLLTGSALTQSYNFEVTIHVYKSFLDYVTNLRSSKGLSTRLLCSVVFIKQTKLTVFGPSLSVFLTCLLIRCPSVARQQ